LCEKCYVMAEKADLARIVSGCQNGDAKSFSELVDIYGNRLYGYFYRLTGNRAVADDLLGELFVKLVERIRSYRGGAFESWLFVVASNIFHDYLRDKQRRQKMLDARRSELQEQRRQFKEPDGELVDKLARHLSRLDGDTRELIMLRFYSGLSFREIAEMRGEPIGTTLTRVHRGLKKLREWMEQ